MSPPASASSHSRAARARAGAAGVRDRLSDGPRYPQWVLVTVLAGLFSVGFTITILAVSIPTIADDLDSSKETLTWVITGPMLAFGVLGPAAGKAGDLFGHKRLYLLSALGAAGFSALTAIAPTAGTLVLFRVLGAAVGAAIGPSAAAMINRLYPREERVRAMGWFSFVAAGAPVLGVVAGGPIVEHLSWRLIFALQVPLLLGVVLAAAVVLPRLERQPGVRFDLGGAVTLGLGITGILYALNRGPLWGWTSPGVLAAFAAGPIGLGAFVAIERRVSHPLIPLDFFRRRNFAVAATASFLTNFAYMGGFIITPLLLAEVFGYGETRIGLLSIARPIAFSVTGPLAGYLATRVGERLSGVTGAVAVLASMLMLAGLDRGSADLVIIGSLAVSGLGLGASQPAFTASVANAVDETSLGVAGAAMQLATQVGIVAGIQLMQTVQLSRVDEAGLVGSYQDAYLFGALVAAAGVVVAVFLRSTERKERAHDVDVGLTVGTLAGEAAPEAHAAPVAEPR